jgi:predicted enzyme related to lactoylglutathione lyase
MYWTTTMCARKVIFAKGVTHRGENPYWMIETGPPDEPGIDGGLMERQGEVDGTAVIAFVCTVDVENLDATMAAVQENGGSIAVEKQPIPGIGWLAYGKDTEGNLFGMMQSDESAA